MKRSGRPTRRKGSKGGHRSRRADPFPEPRSAEDLARAMFVQADRKLRRKPAG